MLNQQICKSQKLFETTSKNYHDEKSRLSKARLQTHSFGEAFNFVVEAPERGGDRERGGQGEGEKVKFEALQIVSATT
jgi:hypothetical protein